MNARLRNTSKVLVFLVVILSLISTSYGQFKNGQTYAGPYLGLSFLGSTAQIGGNVEYAVEEDIGVGGLVRYWSYSESFYWGKFSYSNILLAGQANYHFKTNNKKFDPFVGVDVGYDIQSASTETLVGYFGTYGVSASGGGFIGSVHGGLRYFYKPNLAFVARVGYGTYSYGALDVGVDFTLGGSGSK
ncbi:MAG: hypothetical protein AABZ61_12120 [Bacteroidota bacterium]